MGLHRKPLSTRRRLGHGRLTHHAANYCPRAEPRNGQGEQPSRVENGNPPTWKGGRMTTAKWQCSRCGQWGGNPSCYVCATEPEEQDPDDALDYWEEMRDRRTDWTAEPENEPEQTEKQ